MPQEIARPNPVTKSCSQAPHPLSRRPHRRRKQCNTTWIQPNCTPAMLRIRLCHVAGRCPAVRPSPPCHKSSNLLAPRPGLEIGSVTTSGPLNPWMPKNIGIVPVLTKKQLRHANKSEWAVLLRDMSSTLLTVSKKP